MTEQEVLRRYGKTGWQVVSRMPVTERVTEHYDPQSGQASGLQSDPTRTVAQETGNVRWVLAGPNGEPDEMIVRELPTSSAARAGSDTEPPTQFDVVEGPKKTPDKPATNNNPGKGTTRIVDRGGMWVQEHVVDDKGTWSVDTSVKPVPIKSESSGTTRPPEPNVSTSAPKIPVWDSAKGEYVWQDNPNYTPPKPPAGPQPHVTTIGNRVVRTDPNGGTTVVYEAPKESRLIETASAIVEVLPDGQTREVYKIPQAPKVLSTPSDQPFIVREDASAAGGISTTPNPNYSDALTRAFDNHAAAVKRIDQGVTQGEFNARQATEAKTRLQAMLDAALQGTTPFAMQQDSEARAERQRQAHRQSRQDQATTLREQAKTAQASIDQGIKLGVAPNAGQVRMALDPYFAAIQLMRDHADNGDVPYTALPVPPSPRRGLPQVAGAAVDNQTLSHQDPATVDRFRKVYGDNAAQRWVEEHNAQLVQRLQTQTTPTSLPRNGAPLPATAA
jgi:hypothetical protein